MRNLILVVILLVVAGGVGFFILGGESLQTFTSQLKNSPADTLTTCEEPAEPSPAELEDRQKRREISLPMDFLKLEFSSKKNLLGEWVINGTVESRAEFIRYKDPELEITFVSKTLTELGSTRQVVFEYLEPGRITPFKVKVKSPKGTELVEAQLANVVVEETNPH
ncbi:MAG: hypothetical protein H6581_19060 [Bacteroidia bacterium]|nr:hypothetical protein [Bacteroidia bacterium]